MALTKWSPSTDLFDVKNEFDRLFSQMMNRTPGTRMPDRDVTEVVRPAIDIEEEEKQYIIRAELPGLQEDDIHLAVRNNTLTIQGEKKRTSETDEGSIKATYENGVLHIEVPKTEESVESEIPITVNM